MSRHALWVFSFALFFPISSSADLTPGLISDFESGGLEGWNPPRNNTSNAGGFLEVSPASANNRLSVHNTTINGTIDEAVFAIEVEFMRPNGQTDLPMRLVLFGPGTGNRWTSTLAQMVPGDGVWRTYTYSILESDLTRVQGLGTYADLEGALNRIMFRFNSGAPAARGTTGATGVLNMDNVVALPEPGAAGPLVLAGFALALARRRRA